MAKTAEPKWTLIRKEGNFEIRQYEQITIAQVVVKGERNKAINDGFRILAGYIFGGNTTGQSIEMTSPVLQEGVVRKGEKIAMTAPVLQQNAGAQNEWNVQFIMPENYTLTTLPKPNNSEIQFFIMKPHKVAIVRFSWLPSKEVLDKQTQNLFDWLKIQNLEPIGFPRYAFYDPPWTLPFLRRNEILIIINGS